MDVVERLAFGAYLVWVHFLEALDGKWRRFMACLFVGGEMVFKLAVGRDTQKD